MCCEKLKLLLAPAFYWLFAKTYILFVGSCKSHKKPKLIWFKFRIPCYMYSTAKFQAKSQLQSTIYRSHFINFAQNTKSSFAYCGSSVPHYSFAMVLVAKNQSNFFFFFQFFAFSYSIFIKNLSTSTFVFFFQVLCFSYKTFGKNLLTKSQVSCYCKTDVKNFFISRKDKSQIICKNFETKNSLSIFAHIRKWVTSFDVINFNWF